MKLPAFLALNAIAFLAWNFSCAPAAAHSGGLNSEGCHNNRKTGGYHCHRGGSSDRSGPKKPRDSGDAFPNCTAARNAGATPVRRGDPGYGPHLDRDNDGVGCE
ncbi:MAG: excalibur calcium-binding domain-containing protein [Sphingomicrobium sp.]